MEQVVDLEKNFDQIYAVLEKYPAARLVAVSKTKPNEMLRAAYDLGVRAFGENKVQELADKHAALPQDIEWHFIGHLQRNKVKYLAPFVSLIHSVDSPRLLKEINKRAANDDRQIPCLFQVHIAQEETKFGFSESELTDFLSGPDFPELKNVKMVGLMGMATFTDNDKQVRKEFTYLRGLYDRLQLTFGQADNFALTELSMGMSNDYPIALDCGATLLRLGSTLFGARN